MQTLGAGLDPREIRATVQRERDELAETIQSAGGPEQWWRNSGFGEPPAGLTLEAILLETAGFWRWATDRAVECARCPEHGAACSGPTEVERGKRLAWEAPRGPSARVCPRWTEWVLRDWLRRSGVDPRSVGYTLNGLRRLKPQHLKVIAKFLDTALASATGDAWLVLSGPHASGKTHLAVAVLRAIKERQRGKRCWYASMHTLPRQLKAFYNDEQSTDPMEHVREAEVVVLDNLGAKQPPWLREALEEALVTRWTEQRSTLITTLDSATQLAATFPALTGFQQKMDEIVLPKYEG